MAVRTMSQTTTKDQPEKLDLRSHDIAGERLDALLNLFPEIRTEGKKVDFTRLKLALGESVDVGKERYGLTWPGKADCFKTIQTPSLGTLRPMPKESVNWDTTENLIIEGDNLEVLKLLQKSYLGKVKMIYIDPPYNTGNDFIYPDNYSESLDTYLQYTGQVDAEGKKFSTNTETDGRFHSKWLNMMYPRLYLARNLLREDGAIFVSINDAEFSNLRRCMDDVFGEECFIGTLVWKSRHNVDSRNKTALSSDHEYVVVYGVRLTGQGIDKEKYDNPDNDPRGPWMSDNMVGLATKEQRPNLHYDLKNPETGVIYACPEKGWRYEKETMATKIAEKRILWPASKDGRPRHKKFLRDVRSEFTGFSSLLEVPNTAEGTQEIKELFGEAVFDFPKPVGLLEELVRQGTSASSEDLVLDFFAGSGTTAHAVMKVNAQDGGSRRFILVQLPEQIEHKEYRTIAAITRERVRRASKKINETLKGQLPGKARLDMGFRAYQLDTSNFTTWDGSATRGVEPLRQQILSHVNHIRTGRKQEDLLAEILLKSGFPPNAPVMTLTEGNSTIFSVAEGGLLVCMERKVSLDLLRALADKRPQRVVLLDESFVGQDQLKANAVQTFKSKGVTFKTV
jgi:adenine-specific DNA-methyltransferase